MPTCCPEHYKNDAMYRRNFFQDRIQSCVVSYKTVESSKCSAASFFILVSVQTWKEISSENDTHLRFYRVSR